MSMPRANRPCRRAMKSSRSFRSSCEGQRQWWPDSGGRRAGAALQPAQRQQFKSEAQTRAQAEGPVAGKQAGGPCMAPDEQGAPAEKAGHPHDPGRKSMGSHGRSFRCWYGERSMRDRGGWGGCDKPAPDALPRLPQPPNLCLTGRDSRTRAAARSPPHKTIPIHDQSSANWRWT